jgi:hypothetical protein
VRVRGIVLTLTLLALALPAAAGAQDVPPGNSGIDQYRESIPGPGGNRPTGPGASGTGKSGTGAATGQSGAVTGESDVSPETAQSLGKLGPDGKGAAAVVAGTAPGRSEGLEGGFASASPTSGDSADDDPGMGIALPIIFALALAGALAFVVWRRRRGTPPGAA